MPACINPLRIAGICLGITVLTQILYLSLEASGTPLAMALWRTEAIMFLALALAGATLLRDRPLVGAGLLVGGLANVVQVGIGLTLFEPLAESDGFGALVAFAFYLYFAGKAAFAVAAMALGRDLWARSEGTIRYLGGATGLVGIVSGAINLAAMGSGMALVFPAGAAGTAAALLVSVSLFAKPPTGG